MEALVSISININETNCGYVDIQGRGIKCSFMNMHILLYLAPLLTSLEAGVGVCTMFFSIYGVLLNVHVTLEVKCVPTSI